MLPVCSFIVVALSFTADVFTIHMADRNLAGTVLFYTSLFIVEPFICTIFDIVLKEMSV